jgi:hypothetical protein
VKKLAMFVLGAVVAVGLLGAGGKAVGDESGSTACARIGSLVNQDKVTKKQVATVVDALRRSKVQGAKKTATKIAKAKSDAHRRAAILIAAIWCADHNFATVSTTPAPTTVSPSPAVYDGTGDDVVAITKPSNGAAIVHATYSAGSNFIVTGLDDNNQQTDVLINEIGAYDGSVPLDFRDTNTTRLEVKASGPWHIEVRDPRSAQPFDSAVQGHGDNVLLYTGKAGIAAISHNGQSNFVVDEYTKSGENLLVNEIGVYNGRVPFARGRSAIAIKADGDWSIGVS